MVMATLQFTGLMCMASMASALLIAADGCDPATQACVKAVANEAGDPMQQIAGGIRLTFLYDNIPAWPGVSGSEFRDVPDFLKGHMLDVPRQTFPAGSTVRYSCPNAGRTCEAYVFIYECHPCPSMKGALPTYLRGNGWEASRCAPNFVTGAPGGLTHRMTSYRKEIAPGGIETFDTLGDVEWAAFAISPGDAVDCSTKASVGLCHDPVLKNFCRWNGQCEMNKCVPTGPGIPSNGCPAHTCVSNEWPLAF